MSGVFNAVYSKEYEHEMNVCTRCAYCKVVCPVYEQIRWDSALPRARVLLAYGLIENELEPDESVIIRLYQCTTCKSCDLECSADVKIVDIIEAIRADLAAQNFMLERHKGIVASILKYGNPLREAKSRLDNFGKVPRKNAEVGYFMGCIPGYRELQLAKSVLWLLDKLGVDYTVINERCCGSVLRRIGGSIEDLKTLIDYNLTQIESLNINTLIISCAGCYCIFKHEYPKYRELNFNVSHITEYLHTYKLQLAPLNYKVTYHDPCHLGRHSGVFDAPRNILKRIPGLELIEMTKMREAAYCCGGGGGMRAGFPELAAQIGASRIQQAKMIGADLLVTTCPFCVLNFRKSNELLKDTDRIVVKDVVELVAELYER
jgi:Fe-S oxidoreductase